MQHAISTHFMVNQRLTNAWLDRIWNAGIPLVEIFCARQHLDYQNRPQLQELGHWFRDAQLKLHALHSPMYSDDCWGRSGPNAVITITEPVKSKRVLMVDEIKRAIEIAEYIPFRYLIQHIGVLNEPWDMSKVDAAFNALDELRVFAKQRGVEILIENIPNALSSGERLMNFLTLTHLNLGFCFDTGHANLGAGVEAEFEIMQERIRSTHVHNNDGKSDSHLFPYLKEGGTVDWRRAMKLLRSREQQYPLLLELKEDAAMGPPLDAVQRIFERLESERD